MKDNRIKYENEPIEVNGTIVRFDGKGNPENNKLKIYRMYGDVRLFAEAIQNFCVVNGYTICELVKFQFIISQ